jgi:glucokinase
LDIGGTKTAGGVITDDGKVASWETIPTSPQRGGEAVADDVFALAERLIAHAAPSGLIPSAIGLSLCELVSKEGEILSDATIKWRDIAIERRFGRLRPTVIEADSRAAAFCESRCGAGREFPSFLYVTIGTGISCSLVVDGLPYLGAHGITGTMASGPLTTLCAGCGQPSTSILEHVASGPAIVARYNERARAARADCESVLAAAELGDAIARDVVITASESLGSVMGLLASVLDPHALVVGGGLGSSSGLFWESLVAATRRHIWSDVHRPLPIVQGAYGNQAAMVGAALVALQHATRATD